jgi:SAM-dependent methyltransferase
MNSDTSICEFGAGTGFLADIFSKNYGLSPVCVELDPQLCEHIKKKGYTAVRHLSELPNQFDAIYTSNVLEHIEDDIQALRDLYSKLKQGGRIGIYVPANPILFSQMDKAIGHFRRYRKRELIEKVELANFRIIQVQFDDSLGFFASLVLKFLGYRNLLGLGTTKSLRIYDDLVFPISNFLDNVGLRFFLGKNLLLIGIKD